MPNLEAKKKVLYDFNGPMAAVATPFDKQGNLDVAVIAPYAKYLAKIGVRGVYIIGTTGECYNLTLAEKIAVAQAWRQAIDALPSDQKLTAVINISGTVVSEVIELAKKVEALGFDGTALLPPIYYTATSKGHLVKYVQRILEQGAPNTPFLYYHIPFMTGELKFELEDFLKSALENVPQFVALKFTDNNLIRFGSVQTKFGDKINFFAGFDETLLTTRALGGKTTICASFSFREPVAHYLALVEALAGGNLAQAQEHQLAIAQFCAHLRRDGNFFATLKKDLNEAVAGEEGLHFGTPRSPIWIE